MQIPYIEIYLIVIAIAAWTAAILYKRRRRTTAGTTPEKHDNSLQGGQ
jgi:sensor histidine kinase regulating citrate/malate metabolism